MKSIKSTLSAMPRVGDRIRLLAMDDIQAPPLGTEGIVKCIDDIGTIHVHWDTGSSLGLVPGVDRWEIISSDELRNRKEPAK